MTDAKITTLNITDSLQPAQASRNQSRLKFEMVPRVPDPPRNKGSWLGKIFKGIGAFSPAALFFPPFGTIGGLAGLGLGQVGAKMDYKQSLPDAPGGAPPLAYPGISSAPQNYQGASIAPAAFASDPTLDLVSASRDNSLYSSSRDVR